MGRLLSILNFLFNPFGKGFRDFNYRRNLWKEIGLALLTDRPAAEVFKNLESKDVFLNRNLKKVKTQLAEGESFTNSIKSARLLLPKRYAGYIEEGEKTGSMPLMFELMEDSYTSHRDLKKRALGTAIYPFIVLVIASVNFGFMTIFTEPTFYKMMEDLGGKAPSKDVVFPVCAILVFLLIVVWTVYGYIDRIPGVQNLYERLPVIGKIYRYKFWAQFARVLGGLLDNDVSPPQALTSAGAVIGSSVFGSSCKRVASGMKEGEKLSEALKKEGGFSPMVVWTVSQGELTGNLPSDLKNLAERLDTMKEYYIERATRILEMTLTVLLCAGIGYWVIWYFGVMGNITFPFFM